MNENILISSNYAKANHHCFPFLRYKRECKEAGKTVSVHAWMKATGKLDAKIAHEESVELAEKISAEKEADAKKAIEKEAQAKKAKIKKEASNKKKSE